ncbi:MAG: sugar transferase [Thermodesulfobacteriota bacterium]
MKNRAPVQILLQLVDITLIFYVFFGVESYFSTSGIPEPAGLLVRQATIGQFLVMTALALFWITIFNCLELYPRDMLPERPQWTRKLPLAVTAGAVVQIVGLHFFDIIPFRLLPAWVSWCILITAFFLYRSLVFGLQSMLDKRMIRQVTIVGINDRSLEMYRSLLNPQTRVAFFDFVENPSGYEQAKTIGAQAKLGTLSDFNYDISNQPTDTVIIALPIRSHYDRIQKIIELCARQGVNVQLAANIFTLQKNVRQMVQPDADHPLLYFATRGYATKLQYDIKRWIDIVGSLVGLILLAPVFLIISIWIAWDDGFPVFYTQERIGLNKRRFRIFKFRTMVRNADQMMESLEIHNEYSDGAAFKMTNDPRVIRSGHWLRRTSLDELPQLLNVLLGSMSLVGPRPLPVRDFELFYDDRHRLRFSVKPGMTGLWQISGRNIVKFEEWMGLDIDYTQNWNLLLDLKILFYTIPVVLSGKGAK